MVSFDHRDPGTPEADWARCGALHRAPEVDLTGHWLANCETVEVDLAAAPRPRASD